MKSMNRESFVNVFLFEGNFKNSQDYVSDLLYKGYQVRLERESLDVNIFDCSEIDIRLLREILASVIVKPRGNIKVYLFLNGEELSDLMQNAMLKTLEEPPDYVFFGIICKNAGGILSTLRSRCNYVYTGTLTDKVIDIEHENLRLIERFYEDNVGILFQDIKAISKKDKALSFMKDYLLYLDGISVDKNVKVYETKFEVTLLLDHVIKIVEGNGNCSASLEALTFNILEVLGDYSCRNKI
ncbi:MAG: hypothetical protein ACRDA4_10760 [Filifactoraceae bacterium]